MTNRTKTPHLPKMIALLASTSLLALAFVATPVTFDHAAKMPVIAKAKASDGGGGRW